MILFGGGGGRGGNGYANKGGAATLGTPGVIIIEKAVAPSEPDITVIPDKPWLNIADGHATVTLTSDELDAFDGAKIVYSLDNTSWTDYTAPFTVSETATVYAKIVYDDGESDTAQKEIKADMTAPAIVSAVVDETDMEKRTLTITAADSGSGVKNISVDGVPHTENPYVYPIPEGQQSVELVIEDVAGNRSDPVQQSVRHVDTIPPTIDKVEFNGDGTVVRIEMSDDRYGYGVKGVHVNGVFASGVDVMLPVSNTVAILFLQAEDNEGNLSEVMRVRVPNRSVITDKLTVDSVVFNEDNTQATITASTSDPATTITGIYADGTLLDGNPVTYDIPEGAKYIQLQAVNNEGDKSENVSWRVPGWSEEIDSIVVTSAEFESMERITAYAEDSKGLAIRGIYFNAAFVPENPATYDIAPNTHHVRIQAQNVEGDLSLPVVRRVPGWSEIVDTLQIVSVDFSADGTQAVIKAASTAASVDGIEVNGEFFAENPLTYKVPSGTKKLLIQAVNIEGDRSPMVEKVVPQRSSGGGGSSGDEDGKKSGSGKSDRTIITVQQPEWIKFREKTVAKVDVKSPRGVQLVEYSLGKGLAWHDITRTREIPLSRDGKVYIRVTDQSGEVTRKVEHIRCIDDTKPTVTAVQDGGIVRITGADPQSGVVTLHVNGEVIPGDVVDYTVPAGTQLLTIQAEDAVGHLSDTLELTLQPVPVVQPPKQQTAPQTPAPAAPPAPDTSALEEKLAKLEAENAKLQKENAKLKQTVQKQKVELAQLKAMQQDPPVEPEPVPTQATAAPAAPSTTNMPRVAVIAAAILCFAALIVTIVIMAQHRRRNYAYND